ncbi:phospholipase [Flavobacteriaceae bacterium R38]|nr:phospholipase [Flavobacteriaceae bacterium R38]
MKYYMPFIVLFFNFTSMSIAQNKSLYLKKEYTDAKLGSIPYRILLPEHYDNSKQYPFILMLHGSGERGDDNEKQLVHGASLFLKERIREEYPAIVVFPQCPEGDFWSNVDNNTKSNRQSAFEFKEKGAPTRAMEIMNKMLLSLLEEYNVDMNSVYVGGLSMGGMGTFEIVRRNPDLFAAAFPICGGAHPETAGELIKTDWWIFHGKKDKVVPCEFSIKMADAIRAANGNVKLTIYPEAEHDSWTPAFAESELLPWVFSKKLKH